MRKILLIIFLFTTFTSNSQISDTIYSVAYVSFAPCITSEIGPVQNKFSPTLEIGKQFDGILTLGLSIGKTNCSNKAIDDIYLEFRPNLNIFQLGRFSNTITPGVGYVFGPNTALMLECTAGIEYTCNEKTHINVFFGNYYYSSFSTDVNVTQHYSPTFFGFSIVRFLKSTSLKSLVKLK